MAKRSKHRWFLKEWRKHRGYTQERLAEMAGMSKPYISQLERGVREYNQHMLETFAEVLRCEPGDLVVVDPTKAENLWSLWETMKPVERVQLVEMAKVIKRTGTDG